MRPLFSLILLSLLLRIESASQTGWYEVTSPTTEYLYDIRHDPFFVMWVVGNNGTILKSTDEGETWEVIAGGTSSDLRSLHMPSSGNYWIAGSGGTVIVSTDNGNTWINRSPPTTENLRCIFSRSSGEAYVVGENGTIFKSVNTGLDWAEQSSGTGEHLYAGIGPVSGTSDIAISAGANGVLIKTTDGGNTWFPVSSGTSEIIRSLVHGPAGWLYLVGTSGIILESTDAGDSWHPLVSPTAHDLYSGSTSVQNSNWSGASGANGTLIKTTNAGTTWFAQASPTTEHLYGMLTATNSTHVAIGANGTIIRTTDGGGGAVSVNEDPGIVRGFELYQNYPNPFNPTTRIGFQITDLCRSRCTTFSVAKSQRLSMKQKHRGRTRSPGMQKGCPAESTSIS